MSWTDMIQGVVIRCVLKFVETETADWPITRRWSYGAQPPCGLTHFGLFEENDCVTSMVILSASFMCCSEIFCKSPTTLWGCNCKHPNMLCAKCRRDWIEFVGGGAKWKRLYKMSVRFRSTSETSKRVQYIHVNRRNLSKEKWFEGMPHIYWPTTVIAFCSMSIWDYLA